MRRDRVIILILVIIIAGMGLWVYYLRVQLTIWHSPFFEYRIEPVRNVSVTTWKDSEEVVEYAYDRNQDLSEDSVLVLGKEGRTSTIWVDEDFNGILEVQYLFNKDGRCIARYEDLGQDGFVEEFIHYGTDSVRSYRDRDMDGRFTEAERTTSR